jgi:hypothetical protein
MLSEQRVLELSIRWYFLALNCQKEDADKAPTIFSKAHAFIHVLGYPSDIGCGKKSNDGLKTYAKNLLKEWLVALGNDNSLHINEWLSVNVKTDFENHI